MRGWSLTLDAPVAAQSRSVWSCRAIVLSAVLVLAVNSASGQEQHTGFDIPPQPLTKAIHAFSAATGIEVLVDARHADGRQSPGVKGAMASRAALAALLAGSGLIAEDFAPGTITLSLPATSETRAYGADLPYFANVQRALLQVLCADDRTLPGRYRLALKLWVSGSGQVIRSKRLDTTGSDDLDAVLDAALQRLRIERAPPADFPQPITVVVSPSQKPGSRECRAGASDLRRASSW